jgi:hypothetical protein
MGSMVMEHQLPKVAAIIGKQDSLLAVGDPQDFIIWQAVWILMSNSGDVVAQVFQESGKAIFNILIQ